MEQRRRMEQRGELEQWRVWIWLQPWLQLWLWWREVYQGQRVSWLSQVLLFVLWLPVHTAPVLWLKHQISIINNIFKKKSRVLNLKCPEMPRNTLLMKMNTFLETLLYVYIIILDS